jgi:hypothetical protein
VSLSSNLCSDWAAFCAADDPLMGRRTNAVRELEYSAHSFESATLLFYLDGRAVWAEEAGQRGLYSFVL